MNLDELLKAERSREGFSNETREAMWRGVERAIGGVGGASVPVADTPRAPAKASLPAWKIAAMASAAAIGGAAIGAAAHATWSTPKIVYVERPAAAVAPPSSASSTLPLPPPPAVSTPAAIAPSSAPAPAVRATAPRPSTSPPPPKDVALERERTLLDMARTALARGDAASALSSLDAHAREFPSGQLAEEREVLAIQALAAENRLPEARRRAAAFRTAHPASPLLPVVDDATQ